MGLPPRSGGTFDDGPSPVVNLREIILHRLELRSRRPMSRYALRHAQAQMVVDDVMDRMVLELGSHVYGQRETQVTEIVEEPVWRSWRHQLVGSLPDGFRRRFLTYFWGLEDEALATRVTHTITSHAHRAFPECEMDFPDSLGAPVVFAVHEPYWKRDDLR